MKRHGILSIFLGLVLHSFAQTAAETEAEWIVPDKCTECVGFHDEPQCAAVCPVDCCVDDPDIRETRDELISKKRPPPLIKSS
ncbi:hypothetical protein DM870_26335 [Escherichia coli]|nr:hypothetical protein DM870_26335 [Escherichia coli]